MTRKLLSLISGLMIMVLSLSSLYAQEKPSVNELKDFYALVEQEQDLTRTYLDMYNGYANEALQMGLKNSYTKDLYFLFRYVNQRNFNPNNVYNILNANNEYAIYLRKNGEPYQLYIGNENVTKSITENPFLLIRLTFMKNGFWTDANTATDNLNIITTRVTPYMLIEGKRVYFYCPEGSSDYYILINKEVYGPFNII